VGLKIPHLKKNFRAKIKIFSINNVLYRQFAAVCGKIATFCSYFLNPQRRWVPLHALSYSLGAFQ